MHVCLPVAGPTWHTFPDRSQLSQLSTHYCQEESGGKHRPGLQAPFRDLRETGLGLGGSEQPQALAPPGPSEGVLGGGCGAVTVGSEPCFSHYPGPPLPSWATGSRVKDPPVTRQSSDPSSCWQTTASPPGPLSPPRPSAAHEGTPHPPEASSILVSTSNSAVMWVTSLDGDFRPRRLFLEESHLRVTKVRWQFSGQGRDCCGKGGTGQGSDCRWQGSHLA